MNGLHIEKRLYAEKWPVWSILVDGIVAKVFADEEQAKVQMYGMKRRLKNDYSKHKR